MNWVQSENSHWQELFFYEDEEKNLKYYLHIIYNRTAMERQGVLENWNTTFSIYEKQDNGEYKKIKEYEITPPEPFENVIEHCKIMAEEFLF